MAPAACAYGLSLPASQESLGLPMRTETMAMPLGNASSNIFWARLLRSAAVSCCGSVSSMDESGLAGI